jgi:hypothetical protein
VSVAGAGGRVVVGASGVDVTAVVLGSVVRGGSVGGVVSKARICGGVEAATVYATVDVATGAFFGTTFRVVAGGFVGAAAAGWLAKPTLTLPTTVATVAATVPNGSANALIDEINPITHPALESWLAFKTARTI